MSNNPLLEGLLSESRQQKQSLLRMLVDEIKNEQLAIFIGAGVSASAGLPTWSELINSILKDIDERTNEKDPLLLASRIEKRLGALPFREKVVESLRKSLEASPLHDRLSRLRVNLFVTTNYDRILEDSLTASGREVNVITRGEDIPSISPRKTTVVKLHGDLYSPSSIVITSKDFTSYESKHSKFVEWLKGVFSQRSILFIGTSLSDPIIRSIDDHVIRLLDDFHRPKVLFLRAPDQDDGMDDEAYQIKIDDFKALMEFHRDRGFTVVAISDYAEIQYLLDEISTKVSAAALSEDRSGEYQLTREYVLGLEDKLREQRDQETLRLCDAVLGKGTLPTEDHIRQHAAILEDHLRSKREMISDKALLRGYATLVEAHLHADGHDGVAAAREALDKANHYYHHLSERGEWTEKMLRLRAYLLFSEGNIDEAISSLSESRDPKTIRFRLCLFLDAARFDDAEAYLEAHGVELSVADVALGLYARIGKVDKIKPLFSRVLSEYDDARASGKLEDSPFKGEHYLEHLYYMVIIGFFNRAMFLSGKRLGQSISPLDITDESRKMVMLALEYIDDLFARVHRGDASQSEALTTVLLVEFQCAWLLGEMSKADELACDLVQRQSPRREVVRYCINRADHFGDRILANLAQNLERDERNSWSHVDRAKILLLLKKSDGVWEALRNASTLAVSEHERADVLTTAIDIAFIKEEWSEGRPLVSSLAPQGNPFRRLFDALSRIGQNDDGGWDEMDVLENSAPPREVANIILIHRAARAERDEQWAEAESYYRKVLDGNINPFAMKNLLYVLARQQKDEDVFTLAQEIESLDEADARVWHLKAQAARNLRKFSVSTEAWEKLRNEYPDDPEYAWGHAHTFFVALEDNEALKVLDDFLACDKATPDIMALAVLIYRRMGREGDAFSLLDNCFEKISDNSDLLLSHVDLAYKTGNDHLSGRSLSRLTTLRSEGKLKGGQFEILSEDAIIALVKERLQTAEELSKLYQAGTLPRLVLCAASSASLYRDWAVRTQLFVLPNDTTDWHVRTIYATDAFTLEKDESNTTKLVRCHLPAEKKEIVIDYHALITAHRLGIMDRLEQRFDRIYYTEAVESLIERDLVNARVPQLSRVNTAKNLKRHFDSGALKRIEAVVSENKFDPKHRDRMCARDEGIVLVDAYRNHELEDTENDAPTLRPSTLLRWLYAKGKITHENVENSLREISERQETRRKEDEESSLARLEVTYKVLVEDETLRAIENAGILNVLFKMGVVVFVEEMSARSIIDEVYAADFAAEVRTWQRNLSQTIHKSPVFQAVKVFHSNDPDERLNRPDLEAAFTPAKYAVENKLFLFSDDRAIQNLYHSGKVGIQAILRDLLDNNLIDIDEYVGYFRQLCIWRYRFLVPDADVLYQGAKIYMQNSPGEFLQTLLEYQRDSLRDSGLSMVRAQQVAPFEIGLKYYLEWMHAWLYLLERVWGDENFGNKAEPLTKWVFTTAWPRIPDKTPPDVADNIRARTNDLALTNMLLRAAVAKESAMDGIHELIQRTCEILGVSDTKKKEIVRGLLEQSLNADDKQIREFQRYFNSRILRVAFGKEAPKEFASYLGLPPFPNNSLSEGYFAHVHKAIDERPTILEQLRSVSAPRRLIVMPTKHKNEFEVVAPHELLLDNDPTRRQDGIKLLRDEKSGRLSTYTRNIIKESVETLRPSDTIAFDRVCFKVHDLALKDFFYSLDLFCDSIDTLNSPNADLLDRLLHSDIRTILSEVPPLALKKLDEPELHTQEMQARGTGATDVKKARGAKRKSGGKDTAPPALGKSLSWYLDHVAFFPSGGALRPWRNIIGSIKGGRDTSKMANLSEETLNWAEENKDDPFAALIALDIVLSIRARTANISSGPRSEYFQSIGFRDKISRLLALICMDDEELSLKYVDLAFTRALWNVRTDLARYFLFYIDCVATPDIKSSGLGPESARVRTAWWMAREVTRMLGSASLKKWGQSESIEFLSKILPPVIRSERQKMELRRLDLMQGITYGTVRYHTEKSIAIPLSLLSSFLDPHGKGRDMGEGLFRPDDCFPEWILDVVIDGIANSIVFGEGMLDTFLSKDEGSYHLPSLCVTGPRVLRMMYEEGFPYIGSRRREIVEAAERLTSVDNLLEELGNSKLSDYDKQALSFVALSSTRNILMTGNELSSELLLSMAGMLPQIADFTPMWRERCLLATLDIIWLANVRGVRCPTEKFDLTGITSAIFRAKNEDEKHVDIPYHMVFAFVAGGDLELFRKLVDESRNDVAVYKLLCEVKLYLNKMYEFIGERNRERVRQMLHDLKDIPAATESESGRGVS